MFHNFRQCDRCDNPATVHLTEITSGEKTEKHFCENCARQLQVPQAPQEIQQLLEAIQAPDEPKSKTAKACPECGMTYARFRQHGRFGCPKDYEVFEEEIAKLLQRIHQSSHYAGKTPGGQGLVEQGEELNELMLARRALREAIEAENYEEAAKLRDTIRKLSDGDED